MSTRIIRPGGREWPTGLSEIGPLSPPKALFCRGRALDVDRYHIAIVGTRRATVAGLEVTRELASACAERGMVVVSGMATGIDTAAHRAALEVGGATIAVLGTGVDVCYPRRNEALHRTIGTIGTLCSEWADGVEPQPWHFPRRNRIIVGLAQAVIVVEGGFKSGALITGRIAVDAGRDVLAVPGSARNPMGVGPNELIRRGNAALVTTAEHVFEELGVKASQEGHRDPIDVSGIGELGTQLLFLMDDVSVSAARAAQEMGIGSDDASEGLSELELRGLVTRRLGGYELTATGNVARRALVGASP
jgi:DNA processing protein